MHDVGDQRLPHLHVGRRIFVGRDAAEHVGALDERYLRQRAGGRVGRELLVRRDVGEIV